MLYLDASWLQSVRQEHALTGVIDGEAVHVVTDPQIYAHFCRLNDLLFSDADPNDKEAALIEFIGDCDTDEGLRIDSPSAPSRLVEQIQPALAYLHSAPAGHTGLAELASLTGLSRYQLIRAFRVVTGMTPHAWQLNRRVNLARQRLPKEDDSLAAVAQDLGFADQAHFQRVFKAHAGVTPGRFRA